MTRFALIPLAILANACASAEEAQDNLTDMTHEIQRDIEDLSAESDRSSTHFGQRVYTIAQEIFSARLQSDGCEMVGAVFGQWQDRSFKLKTELYNASGETVVGMVGGLSYDDNHSGELGAKGYIQDENTIVVMEGDWYRHQLEADLTFNRANDKAFRIIGVKVNRGLGGMMLAAGAHCE
jgi:hypothetical protein